jgi:hypothetical protein
MLFALDRMLQECGMHPFLVALLGLTCPVAPAELKLEQAGSWWQGLLGWLPKSRNIISFFDNI